MARYWHEQVNETGWLPVEYVYDAKDDDYIARIDYHMDVCRGKSLAECQRNFEACIATFLRRTLPRFMGVEKAVKRED